MEFQEPLIEFREGVVREGELSKVRELEGDVWNLAQCEVGQIQRWIGVLSILLNATPSFFGCLARRFPPWRGRATRTQGIFPRMRESWQIDPP